MFEILSDPRAPKKVTEAEYWSAFINWTTFELNWFWKWFKENWEALNLTTEEIKDSWMLDLMTNTMINFLIYRAVQVDRSYTNVNTELLEDTDFNNKPERWWKPVLGTQIEIYTDLFREIEKKAGKQWKVTDKIIWDKKDANDYINWWRWEFMNDIKNLFKENPQIVVDVIRDFQENKKLPILP